MAVAVDIYVKDNQPAPVAIAGVSVALLNPTTFAVIATATTDADGRAAFLVPGAADPGETYEVRFYKLGVTFANPKRIQVLEPLPDGEENVFDMTGVPTTLVQSADSRCCRCTGLFVNFANRPVAGAVLHVMQKLGDPTPKVVDGNLVYPERMTFQTNANGYVSFDLFRGGRYYAMFAGEEEVAWEFVVPDQPSMNLIELMFPKPAAVEWDENVAAGDAVSLAVGETLEVPFSVILSSLEEKTEDLGQWVDMLIGDSTIVEATISGGNLVLTGLAAGTTTATPKPYEGLKPNRVPETIISAIPLAITVTA